MNSGFSNLLKKPAFICSVPKSGTYLLKGILTSIFGEDIVFPPQTYGSYLLLNELDIPTQNELKNKIYFGHIQYSKKISERLAGLPKILLVRDPRDYIVSQAYYWDKHKKIEGSLEQIYRELPSWDVKLSAAIFGMRSRVGNDVLLPVNESFMNHCINWLYYSNSLLVRFEDIVGSQFGGDNSRVIQTVRSILKFIGSTIEDEGRLLDCIYLGSDPAKSQTFRSGKIGSWRQEFNADHVKQFKLVAPGLVSGLGYERDEAWDLKSSFATTKHVRQELRERRIYNLQILRSAGLPTLGSRYQELLEIVCSSPILVELVDAWAFKSFVDVEEYHIALPILDKLLTGNPQEPEWNYYKAVCLQCLGENLHQAVDHYNKALDGDYEEFWVRYNRGALFKKLDDLENSYVDLRLAVALDPTHEDARKILAEVEATRSKPKACLTITAEQVNKIRDLINKNEYQKATLLLAEFLNTFPVNAELNYLYAFCLHQQKKDLMKALKHYNIALENCFDEYWVKYNRGSLLTHIGDLDSALIDINRAIELKPNDNDAKTILNYIRSSLQSKT